MRHFTLTLKFPAGSPLIGGAAAHIPGVHQAHAQGHDDQPYIPATAIRGALRETFEALLRGVGQPACSGGDGLVPGISNAHGPTRPKTCLLDSGRPCVACRLFGRRGHSDAGNAWSSAALVLEDAILTGTREITWTTRPGVSIRRKTRSAADKRWYLQRVPTSRVPLTFEAQGRLREAKLEASLRAALRATTHIGGNRSRGMGRVQFELCWRDRDDRRDGPIAPELPPGDAVAVYATLQSPALLGGAIVDANFRDTRLEIPGATVRGAIGFALADLLGADANDSLSLTLFDEVRGAHFGFLYPVDSHSGVPGPLPITTLACKVGKRSHPATDTTLRRLALTLVSRVRERGRAVRMAELVHAMFPSECRECQAPLRSAQGTRTASEAPRTRTITRVSIERTRSSARSGDLFTQTLLERDTVLAGTIRNIPSTARGRLAQALSSGVVSFGRGRSHGWGKAEIRVAPLGDHQRELPALEERARIFEQLLGQTLRRLGLGNPPGRFVPVTLLSPLVVSNGDGDGARLLTSALGANSCALAARRFVREGAWNRKTNHMQPFWAACAGSVYVVELDSHWSDIIERLKKLERDGVGERRYQGYGHVICFDHHIATYTTMEDVAHG